MAQFFHLKATIVQLNSSHLYLSQVLSNFLFFYSVVSFRILKIFSRYIFVKINLKNTLLLTISFCKLEVELNESIE